MIEIIKPKTASNEVVCPNCGALLRYEQSDLDMCYNEQGIDCPACLEWIVINTFPPFKFPISFYKCSDEVVKLTDEQIQIGIDACLKELKQSEEENDYSIYLTGDTLTFALKQGAEITCYVCKEFYEAFESYG